MKAGAAARGAGPAWVHPAFGLTATRPAAAASAVTSPSRRAARDFHRPNIGFLRATIALMQVNAMVARLFQAFNEGARFRNLTGPA
ncbi:hypothetical protein Sya03_48390 [Spirilliplanes yamanashiensis]|uniref:Uncharacterized protein n=1 Tax=Spirilliplanes yamanashiensis TaxID=42233 RepID=A0A8J4DKN3_9ACTN|nr:hypothetical protein Sya03_48390 [Spirilliplanes yamanashiensis]